MRRYGRPCGHPYTDDRKEVRKDICNDVCEDVCADVLTDVRKDFCADERTEGFDDKMIRSRPPRLDDKAGTRKDFRPAISPYFARQVFRVCARNRGTRSQALPVSRLYYRCFLRAGPGVEGPVYCTDSFEVWVSFSLRPPPDPKIIPREPWQRPSKGEELTFPWFFIGI